MTPAAEMTVRKFLGPDLAEYVAIRNAVNRERPISVEDAQDDDARWDGQRYHLARYVAEEACGRISGWGEIAHIPWHFHPRKYGLRLEVHPGRRRRGIGGRLLTRLLEELQTRDALLVRAEATEGNTAGISF